MKPRPRRVERADQYQRPSYRQAQARIAVHVRRLRTEREWSQAQAAEKCAMTLQHYQRAEAGGMNATLTTLARLADGFGVDLSVLFAPVKIPARLLDPDRPGRDDKVR